MSFNISEVSMTTSSNALPNSTDLPMEMKFNDSNLISIILYAVLLAISGISNTRVLCMLYERRKRRKSKINLMIMHLAIADLLVTLLNMPLEIAWKATVSWNGGDFMCRMMSFFRIFGLYLSSNILICISVDRFTAVKYPLHVQQSHRRSEWMLIGSWIIATICSAPQVYVFHVAKHHIHVWYEQCITFGSFESKSSELVYNMLAFVCMYALPLLVIVTCYSGILMELHKQSSNRKKEKNNSLSEASHLRRSGTGNIGKAKIQTIKMTSVIVTAFIICWTPYYVMSLWYWFSPDSAQNVDRRIQETLFIFAVSNSCVNPIVYGYFSTQNNCFLLRRVLCWRCFRDKPTSSVVLHDFSRTRRSFLRSTFVQRDNHDGIQRRTAVVTENSYAKYSPQVTQI